MLANTLTLKSSLKPLKDAFLYSLNLSLNKSKVAVLFSGGLDSSLIAHSLSKITNVTLFSVGMENSLALKRAEKNASLLKLPIITKTIDEEQIKDYIGVVSAIINTNDFLHLSIAIPEYFAMHSVKEHSLKFLFLGQGADELFFGYDEFRAALANGKDYEYLEQLRIKKLSNLYKDNLFREYKLANYFNLKLRFPYLEKQFISKAMLFSAEQNIYSEKDMLRKHILRELASYLSLPKSIVNERKKAIQYDTLVAKVLKKYLNEKT